MLVKGVKDSSATWNDLNLIIRADRQYADLQQDHLVAEGNVRLHLAGGDLAAERVTYERGTGLLTAVGAVRFQRGFQYNPGQRLTLQPGNPEGGVAGCVWGCQFRPPQRGISISEVHKSSPPLKQERSIRMGRGPSCRPWPVPPPQPPGGPGRPGGPATIGWQSLVPPLGCPNPDGHAQHHQDEVNAQWSSPVDQRVHGITSRTGLKLEYRLVFANRGQVGETEDDEEREGGEDPVIPAAFSALEQSRTLNQGRGQISRWRFQAEALFLTPDGWTSPLVVLTNDPLTPAQVILEGRDSEVREQSNGSLILTSATNRGLLDGKLSRAATTPALTSTTTAHPGPSSATIPDAMVSTLSAYWHPVPCLAVSWS